jgi:hypothetical protein
VNDTVGVVVVADDISASIYTAGIRGRGVGKIKLQVLKIGAARCGLGC